MRGVLAAIVIILAGLLSFLLAELNVRSKSVYHVYQNRLEAPCTKCGSEDVRPRYCKERCESPSPTLDPQKRGAPVIWGHEHIHRACGSCSYALDIMECLDKAQP